MFAQPGTEVYLFDIAMENGKYKIQNPVNVSQNPGFYDNQPSFSGENELFISSTRDGQTDILSYTIDSGEKKWLTATGGSEYSPTKIPGQKAISAINLKPEGEQLLWKYPISGEPVIIIPDLKIGYHVWLDENSLFVFVLEENQNSLYYHNLEDKSLKFIASEIGRCLKIVPGEDQLSYVDKSTKNWKIMIYDLSKNKISKFAPTPEGSEDFIWLDDLLVMGSGSKIRYWKGNQWIEMVDLSSFGLSGITRMAINNSNDKLSVVVTE